MELIVVRHPAVAVEPGVCYGRSDVPLAGGSAAIVAAEFAEGLVTRIAEASPARARWLDTSPSIRCASVAAHLGARYGLAVREDADLMELDHGRWEMARWDTIERAQLDAWAADLDNGRPHGGESAAMLAMRVDRWLASVERRQTQREEGPSSVLAVTHGGVIRMLASRLLHEPLGDALRRPLGFGALCRFVRAPSEQAPMCGWRLEDWSV